ncbi:MAG: hypothetical protein WCK82_14515 [Bacteroidota bacterium]
MSAKKIYHVIEVCQKMIKTFPKQGHKEVVFNAYFYKNSKKLNSIEKAVVSNFSPLVRSYVKSENPDKIKVEFKDTESGTLIWSKSFEWMEVDEGNIKSLEMNTGLGEVEINEMVQRKFSEMEKAKRLEEVTAELTRLQGINEELEFQVQDMQNTLEAKKQVEYYTNIIGMALPGLAKFFEGTSVAPALNFLSGNDTKQNSISKSGDEQRDTILEMIHSFCSGLTNQELGTIYLMLSEIEKDRSNMQKILQHITQAPNQQAQV